MQKNVINFKHAIIQSSSTVLFENHVSLPKIFLESRRGIIDPTKIQSELFARWPSPTIPITGVPGEIRLSKPLRRNHESNWNR